MIRCCTSWPTRGGRGHIASKHGIVGLVRAYASDLAGYRIRVNSVHPADVNPPLVVNHAMRPPVVQDPALSDPFPVRVVEPADVSGAVLWLVSDDARYVTGATLPVDAGFTNNQ